MWDELVVSHPVSKSIEYMLSKMKPVLLTCLRYVLVNSFEEIVWKYEKVINFFNNFFNWRAIFRNILLKELKKKNVVDNFFLYFSRK